MSKINWQQPFVNTFKHFTIASDKNAAKYGDVTTIMDSQVKATVYKITGASPSTNYINMPKHTGQSLGLTGRYIYILFKPTANKHFAIHIDVATQEKVTVRVSFSSLFRELKQTATWLQVPYVVQAPRGTVHERASEATRDLSGQCAPPVTRWTVLCVDLPALMSAYSTRTYAHVRGFKLCACMLVKNVITSDVLYEPGLSFAEAKLRGGSYSSFPRELAFPCERHESWQSIYDHVAFPADSFKKPFDSAGQSNYLSDRKQEPCVANTKQVFTQSSHDAQATGSSSSAINGMTSLKKPLIKKKLNVFNLPLVGVESVKSIDREQHEQVHFVSPNSAEKQNQQDIHVYPTIRGGSEQQNDEFFSPSGSSLSGSNNNNDLNTDFDENLRLVEDHDASNDKKVTGLNYQTSLEPDPILRLRRIIGFGSNCDSQSTSNHFGNIFKWTRDNQYIVYACQAICIAHHVTTSVQYCFVGHSDRVACLTMSPCGGVLASGQAGPHGLVRLWDFASRKCLKIFRAHVANSLRLLEYSQCGRYLAAVGLDKQGKTLLIVWDVSNSSQCKSKSSKSNDKSFVKVVASAHTDVHIARIIFVPFDSSRLITCGRDNVRFWRVRNETLRSCAVNLAPYAHLAATMDSEIVTKSNPSCLEFTDICVSTRADNNENLAYACTRGGQIFVLNMARMEVENVRVLEPVISAAKQQNKTTKNKGCLIIEEPESLLSLRLNSLAVSDSFCATGSDDGFVRIWTLDFGQVSVEAEHEAAIGLVRFSPDCFKIATATVNGNLGVLDVKRKEYSTLVRSHTDSIVDISIDATCRLIATCSLDATVRVWHFETGQQLYDFSAPNERPTRLCFITAKNVTPNSSESNSLFACGFTSGTVRIFNVDETKLLKEIRTPHLIQQQQLQSKVSDLIGNKFEVTDLTYCQNGRRLLVGDSLRYLSLYDVERDYALVRLLSASVSVQGSLCLSEDTKNVALIGPNESLITVFDTSNLNEILRINVITSVDSLVPTECSALKLAYGPSELGQLVCITTNNRLLKFDSRNGRLLSSMQQRVHRSSTDSVAVSTDGSYLATSGDHCVKVWDYGMRLDRNSQAFVGHSAPVTRLLFTADKRHLVSVGDSIIVWEFMAYGTSAPQMPQGRSSALLPLKTSKSVRKKDTNEIRVLNETSFEQMRQQISDTNEEKKRLFVMHDDGFERPRTPPIAAESGGNMQIETIVEDTFFNEEENDTMTETTVAKPPRKFIDLPNLMLNNNVDFAIQKEEKISKKCANLQRKKDSCVARQKYVAPANKCGLKLNSVIGYNGKYAAVNMIWNAECEFFAYTLGSIVCCESLKTGVQTLLYAHCDDITALALRYDQIQMVSVSPAPLPNTTLPLSCQIIVWNCVKLEKVATLYHENANSVRVMCFSTDDRFLITVSECSSVVVWRTSDYTRLVCTQTNNGVLEVAWSPLKCNELVLSGRGRLLAVCRLDERSNSLQFNELEVPLVVREQQPNDKFDFTALAYSEDYLLFAATNHGLVTVWSVLSNLCLLNWQADVNEIDVLVSVKHKLITGSSKGSLKLWNIAAIHKIKQRSGLENRSLRLESLIIDNELQLNSGAVKCCTFDPALDIGIVATSKNTLWYVNWREENSLRLVSTHMGRINSVCCIDDRLLATVSDDGSLNIWSLSDRERLIQFEVKASALCQALVYCDETLFRSVTRYTRTSKATSPLVIVGYVDGYARLYDIDKKNIVYKIRPIEHGVTAINHCKNSQIVLLGSSEGTVCIVDLEQRIATRMIEDHRGSCITSLDSFYDQAHSVTYWLACSQDHKISVWSCKWSEDMLQMIDWITFSDTSSFKNVKITTSVTTSPSLAKFEHLAGQLVENLVYVGYGHQKQLTVYNFVKKQIVRTLELSEWPQCLCLSNRLSLLALGTRTRLLQLKDYAQSSFQDYSQHSDTVSAVCFSNDDRKLISTAHNEIFIWDVNV